MASQLNQPHVPRHPARLRDGYDRMVRAAGVQGRFIRRQSGRVHVIEAGDGPPVVHLHGNNTSSLSHLMLLEHMATVRSYLVDRPGFGLSDPDDFPRSSFRHCAVRFVDDVLDELQLESAVLAGASGAGPGRSGMPWTGPGGCAVLSCSGPSRCFPAPAFPWVSGSWRHRCWATSSAAS